MTPENTPRIDIEELIRRVKPIIKTVGTGIGMALAMGEIMRTKVNLGVNSLTFEKELIARYDQLIAMGLTEEQAMATLRQSIDNIVAKVRNANQEEDIAERASAMLRQSIENIVDRKENANREGGNHE